MDCVSFKIYDPRTEDRAGGMATDKLPQRCTAFCNQSQKAFLHPDVESLKIKEDVGIAGWIVL
jgi:hypothetical protein